MAEEHADLVVIGSGAAGLSAALTAARTGADVVLLEATDKLGGTTALSGAILWAPANRWQRAAGIEDSIETARAYIARCLGPRAEDPRWDLFLNRVNPLIDELLVGECGMQFDMCSYSDSFGEWPEGRTTRHLVARPFPMRQLGSWKSRMRQPAIPGGGLMTARDVEKVGWIAPSIPPAVFKLIPTILGNLILNRRAMGVGLVAAMTAACLRRGVRIFTDARVTSLLSERNRVTGVTVARSCSEWNIASRRGVVLACGGFSADTEARESLLPGPYVLPQEPPVNRGDNLRLARQMDADLRYLNEAWNIPSSPLDTLYMGERIGQTLVLDRMLPHQIWVNRDGKRFVNEGSQNAAEAFYVRDAEGRLPNYPCFSIFDQQYRDKYLIYLKHNAKAKGPAELIECATLEGLAQRIGVTTEGLLATVRRYNDMVRKGHDDDFGRGDGAYERYFTGAEGSLGTIEKGPFYALPVYSGGVGTKGGPMTDIHGRVLRRGGSVIEGFYAAGNASAAFNGPITVAAGCTIPPALVMGNAAALHAMGRSG